jgi:ribonuclease P/MRP protein subunit POP1
VLWKPYDPGDNGPRAHAPPAPGSAARGGAANARRRIGNRKAQERRRAQEAERAGKAKASEDQGKGKGKGKEQQPAAPQATDESTRVVWVRAHPAHFDALFAALRDAASAVLASLAVPVPAVAATATAAPSGSAPAPAPAPEEHVELADLREQLLAFDVLGPRATHVLRGALRPAHGGAHDARAAFRVFWAGLRGLQSAESVPRGMVVGFTVDDPRLQWVLSP